MNNDFYTYYSTLSTVELLKIQATPQNYQPEAVEAALAVLQLRTVTGDDEKALADMTATEQEAAEQKRAKKEALKTLAMKAADTALPGKEKTPDQQLILFCAGLGIIYLYTDYREFSFVYRAIIHGHIFDRSVLLIIVELIITPTMIYLLYKKKKAGWTMAVSLYTAAFIFAITETVAGFGNPFLFLEGHSTSSSLVSLVIEGAVLYYLNTFKVMELFIIGRKWRLNTIKLSVIFTFFLMLLLSMPW